MLRYIVPHVALPGGGVPSVDAPHPHGRICRPCSRGNGGRKKKLIILFKNSHHPRIKIFLTIRNMLNIPKQISIYSRNTFIVYIPWG